MCIRDRFAFEPLPYVKNLYYLDVNFYRYFIGRDDQSVNEKVMIIRKKKCCKPRKIKVCKTNLKKLALTS